MTIFKIASIAEPELMFPPRLHVSGDLAADSPVALDAGQAHYLGRVLRLGVGAPVLLFNGRDGEWTATIAHLGRADATAVPGHRLRPQNGSADLWLCFAPLKKDATDAIVIKATELGATRLMPVLTRRTESVRVNTGRLRANAVEAAEQTERLDLPEIAEPVTLDRLLAAWPVARPLLVCAEAGPARPLAAVAAGMADAPVGFLVGPEGGFTPEELDLLRDLPFVRAVGLGPRILRADTAALAALAIWQAIRGDGAARPPMRG
jgi:16S rRNA (uracil1498-N3)-methyltransferase